MNNINNLNDVFSKLKLNLKEYSKIEELTNTIKKDNSIRDEEKIKIYLHINDIYFDKKQDELKTQNKNIEKKRNVNKTDKQKQEKPLKQLCKKCNKTQFKKFEFCYKHCQEEYIIPKNIKRKDYNEYEKNININKLN